MNKSIVEFPIKSVSNKQREKMLKLKVDLHF